MLWLLLASIFVFCGFGEGATTCKQLQGYHTGVFFGYGDFIFKGQFQYTLTIDANAGKIYASMDDQDVRSYGSSSETVFLNLYTSSHGNYVKCTAYNLCEVRYYNDDYFLLYLDDKIQGPNVHPPVIFSTQIINDKFKLHAVDGQCMGGDYHLSDSSFCICCGDYKSGGYRNCPVSPWADPPPPPTQPTCKPTTCKPTTCKPTTCKPTTCKPTTCKPTTCKPTPCESSKPTNLKTTQKPTSGPDANFVPCRKRIAFAFDDSSTNLYFNASNNFLVNHVFANGAWNHLERLGLLWYSNKHDKNVSFDVLNDKKHLNLDYVRHLISNKPVKSSSSSNVTAALQFLAENFQPNDDYDEVFYVVFVSQKMGQAVVDAAQPFADALTYNGRLIFIGLGDVGDELYDLSPYYTIWYHPDKNPVLPDWSDFFWEIAYGCEDDQSHIDWLSVVEQENVQQ